MKEFQDLLKLYEDQNNQVLKAKSILEELIMKRSDIVKKMDCELRKKDPKSKKFSWKGKEITIVCRPSREGEKETWFLRGSKDSNILSFE